MLDPHDRARAAGWDFGIVADDVTGAQDSAIAFVRRGGLGVLSLSKAADTNADTAPASASDPPEQDAAAPGFSVLAISADSRAYSAAAARTAAQETTDRLREAPVGRLFVKIDSTMRGAVHAQIAGAMRSWRTEHPDAFAVVCPAYPESGRTVEGGTVLVDGIPLHRSASGRDPLTPAGDAGLAGLLPGSRHAGHPGPDSAPDLAALLTEAAARIHGDEAPVFTVDARTTADLGIIARVILSVGPRAVPVGSAGLADAIAREREHSPGGAPPRVHAERVLVVLTSLHPVARAQEERLRSALADGRMPGTVLLSTPVHSSPGRPVEPAVADRVAAEIALETSDALSSGSFDALIVVGGDGARAVLDRIGARSVRLLGTLAEGTPFGRIVGGHAEGLLFITKSGGFGTADTLTGVVDSIRTAHPRDLRQPPQTPTRSD